jgi:hypothetical protein
MRVAADTRELTVDPGATTAVVVDVVNTGQVIDGVSARVIGLPEPCVTTQPRLLPLFPEAGGQLTLSLAVPPTHPAGRHPLTVEVVSHGARVPSQFVDLDLTVAARPRLRMTASPRVMRARRSGRFVLELTNDGNVPLDVSLTALDADRSTRCEFVPTGLRVEAGAVAPVLVKLRGPRMITGGEIDRTVTVEAIARTAQDDPEPGIEAETQAVREVTVRLRQRPLISRGLLTALILAGIVGLWAGVFLLGLTKVFAGDPMTKQAPASFFLPPGAGSGAGSGTAGSGGTGAGGAALAAPAGSLPKSGQLPAGTGGTITGTVIAASDHQPVGRILVQAMRTGRNGLQLVSSAATQSDGTYSLGGLFPTSYYLKFSANGYPAVWYPSVPAQTAGQQVSVAAQGTTSGVNTVITGLPASISGSVNPGDTLTPVATTVTARALFVSGTAAPASTANAPTATTTTAADGSYQLPNLPAPGSYELTFTTPGYQPTTLVDTVGGGDARLEPAITLGATAGQVAGTVTDGTNPIGGATVSTTVGGRPLTVTTPTTGQVGAFLIGNLPTPGTYVMTFSAPGHGTSTTIVDLAAGQTRNGLGIVLSSGTGSVAGRLVDGSGNGLGGASVTVGGATSSGTAPPGTTTLTTGSIGSFAVNGLSVPGSYTLTFTLPGYVPATVPVTLAVNGAPPSVTATLSTQLGGITGAVRESRAGDGTTIVSPFVGATVTASNGRRTWTTTSSGAGGALPNGGYLITGLQPGTYSVTVTAGGLQQQTGIITVAAGQNARLDLALTKPGS